MPWSTGSPPSACRTMLVACAIALVAGCGTRGGELHRGDVEIDRPTTTGGTPCQVVGAAELALTEASLTAARADDAAIAEGRRRLDELERGVPSALADDVQVLRRAFESAWTGRTEGNDPFDTTAYLTADQALRRFIASGCLDPGE